ncbi:MAG TPA: Imm52 family immunity protein [Myxococcaceae bacterium]|jgi:hypothetical protein
MTDKFYLGAYWQHRSCTLREYIAGCMRFMTRLGALHPVFQELVMTGKAPDAGVRLLSDLSNLEELVFQLGPRGDDLFTHAKPDGSPTLDSEGGIGFATSYSNKKRHAEERVAVSISTGKDSPWLTNAVVIEMPEGVREFREYEFVKKLLETTVECWEPSMAVVTSHALREKLGGKGGTRTIGWMTWFKDSSVAKALPKRAERETLAGGVLVTTAREIISPENPSHVATALQIRDTLLKRGFLQ